MAYEGKKELGVVKEQPGSKQKIAPQDKAPKKKESFDNQKASRFESTKSDSAGRMKSESSKGEPETSLNHPSCNYDSYKRPRKDS